MEILKMLGQILLLVLTFVFMIKGADVFVDGASKIAVKCDIPEMVVGLTIVAMGTSAPEAICQHKGGTFACGSPSLLEMCLETTLLTYLSSLE